MRLIDAHRLLDKIETENAVDIVIDIIDAPTVNAIPVEWIVKWSAEHLQEYGTLTISKLLEDWENDKAN